MLETWQHWTELGLIVCASLIHVGGVNPNEEAVGM